MVVLNHEFGVKGQQTAINVIFITLTNGVPGEPYTLTLKDSIGTKDQISITPDRPTVNLNYSPPPGVTININDQICASSGCFPIPTPDSFGTSSMTVPPS